MDNSAVLHVRPASKSGELSSIGLDRRSGRHRFTVVAIVAAIASFLGLVAPETHAAITTYTTTMDVAQATTAVAGETGTGSGTFTYDSSTMQLTYNITFTGLSFPEILAHIHTGAVGVIGGIVFMLPFGEPKVGMATLNAGEEADLLADLLYVNIHTENSPSGGIRGQVIRDPGPIPALTWPALVIFAIFLCAGGAWQIKRMGRLTQRI